MAIRTTENSVQAILGGHYDGSTSLTSFIKTANLFTNRIANADTKGLMGEDDLKDVETYLAAHFYAHADQITQSKSTGRASGQFQGRTDLGFDATLYGQTAKRLDATGLLVLLDQPQRPKATCLWLGKVFNDQLDADERSS